MKNKIIALLCIIFVIITANITCVFGSFADFTDEEADKNAEQQMEEQKKENNVTEIKSTNNYLKNLSVKGHQLTSEFDKQTLNYELKEEINTEFVEISAETDDEKSSVSGIGKIQLNSGENNIRIDVTAESGTVRTYFIKAIKSINKDIRLSALKLKTEENNNIEITPEFDKDIFEYNCNVQNYIRKIDVEANANDENANIEITGNENLKEGLNEILITVFLDGDEKTTYKINVNKETVDSIQKEERKTDTKIIIVSIVVVIIILAIIILLYKITRRKKGIKHKGKH